MKNKYFTMISFVLSVVSFLVFLLKVEFNTPSSSVVWSWILLMLALLMAVILSSYLTGIYLHSTKITVITGICIAIGTAALISNIVLISFCILTL